MSFNIIEATKDHATGILGLIKELAEYEKMADQVKVTEEQLANDLENKAVLGYVAEKNGNLVGMLLFYYAYSTWQGQYIHMEDLYIRESFRRSGLGRLLWRKLAQNAREKNFEVTVECSRLCKSDKNPKGGSLFRMTEEQIDKLASSPSKSSDSA
ncbi:unnamed protein product [Caenorhabditis auriculariae]|uniref:N-acetyltransferase domain-containing protein n=1 Tax=Caenorhabditis auriculariae TaxID=2777116 RepID=A0A8S1H1Z0_9PELO|nr:unnamed protein product [Caenorhabditis auriculariae]